MYCGCKKKMKINPTAAKRPQLYIKIEKKI